MSGYAGTNKGEDLAEHFVAYRYLSDEFKLKCPVKYNAMKEIFFEGKEFLASSSCQ